MNRIGPALFEFILMERLSPPPAERGSVAERSSGGGGDDDIQARVLWHNLGVEGWGGRSQQVRGIPSADEVQWDGQEGVVSGFATLLSPYLC